MEFRDLKRQYSQIKKTVDDQINSVIESSHFISGSQVRELEALLADYVGRKHCITCANGTDAITIALRALGIGSASGGSKSDVVFVPNFTFFSSGECPALVGATPIFVDVLPDTYNINPEALIETVKKVISEGDLVPRAVVAVDLFGQPFDYDKIQEICDEYDMFLIEDAAQGFGGEYESYKNIRKKACKLGDISTTSFFPAKPLGCYGDGGAIFTDDVELANLCRSLAVHGKDMGHPDDPNAKYNNVRIGYNSRLDTIQAGILLAKFPTFCDYELDAVNHVASEYFDKLADTDLILPKINANCYSSWAQFTVQLPKGMNRTKLQNELRIKGIPTNVYYIKPMNLQAAYVGSRSAYAECPVSEMLCNRVLCLPIHPYMQDEEIEMVTDNLKEEIEMLR